MTNINPTSVEFSHHEEYGLSPATQEARTETPIGPNSVTISDGMVCVGTITFDGKRHHFFDPRGCWLGAYSTRIAAMRARSRGARAINSACVGTLKRKSPGRNRGSLSAKPAVA
jgi:hypothetical protein